MVTLHRVSDVDELISSAARKFIDVVTSVQAPGGGLHNDGVARVVLTGGGAGIGTLRELARLDAAAKQQSEDYPALAIDWTRVHVFFGDERNVPVSDPDSNEGQARAALLHAAGVPEEHIHGLDLGAIAMEHAAKAYAGEISEFAPNGFDLHLLGMGGEGHINSMFPHSEAVMEQEDLVVAVPDSPKPPAERVTLTLPAVNRSERVWFLVSGEEKAEAASHIVAGSPAIEWPAAGAHGTSETILFLSDDAATVIEE
ncbi:6-phosphogluconolactonase [Corynebacterium sp. HMSC06D04]|uniref:6-phosphogluconolactonase n=1 Tax=Corynebacterium simulans TaxID=146827 RepID=A0ABR5VAR3_9CORY|nr:MULTISPECIES: 6-phosphogluconolactonase [Corynebacterium]KXU18150.1 6-phosphogluconolactonase [Corynebacterium simulans]OFT35646.1 6-phosphogluconolactonase [Corynebacterium sp. HMSC08C04]OFT51153.1 6-phosphogluconolactonase [Corynebacterium sp. HMSC06D04]